MNLTNTIKSKTGTLGVLALVAVVVTASFTMPVVAHSLAVIDVASGDGGSAWTDNAQTSGGTFNSTSGYYELDGSTDQQYETVSFNNSDVTEVNVDVASVTDSVDVVVIDGSGSTVQSVSVSSSGSYTLNLDPSNDTSNYTMLIDSTPSSGISEFDAYSVIQTNSDPTASTVNGDRSVAVDETFTLDGTDSTDPDGDNLTYEWDLDNDGTYESTGSSVDHSFASAGANDVTLKVTDDHGATDTTVVTVDVGGQLQIAAEDADGNPVENATVTVTDSNGNVVSEVNTNADGLADHGYLAGADYDVEISHTDYEVTTTSVTVNTGGTTFASYNLQDSPATGSVYAEVWDGDTQLSDFDVRLVDGDGNVVHNLTASGDSVIIDNVETGDYTLEADHPDYSDTLSKDITVNENEETAVELNFDDGTSGGSGTVPLSDTQLILVIAGIVGIGLVFREISE